MKAIGIILAGGNNRMMRELLIREPLQPCRLPEVIAP